MTEQRREQIAIDFGMNQLNYDWDWMENNGYDHYKLCWFITKNKQKWNDFIEQNKQDIVTLMKEEVWLKNKERWIWNTEREGGCGFRPYKVKVDKNVSEIFLNEIILPCCNICCDFEWI